MAMTRVQLTLPDDLLKAIDEFAGERGRSEWIAAKLEPCVARERLRAAIDALREEDPSDAPPADWDGMDSVEWVRQLRGSERDSWAETAVAAASPAAG
ncbi:MAG: ribbon-helix-helix domain-containing protein [Dehalococcoidia bacterium]